MSHVLAYDGQFFRVDITEVANPDDPDKSVYISWCSDAFKELKDMPRQAISRYISGPPLSKYAEARRHAYDWIKNNWDTQKSKRGDTLREIVGVIYTVWLYKGDSSVGFEFVDFSDAKAFAKAAENSAEITKVEITNNESPQYLTIWEKAT